MTQDPNEFLMEGGVPAAKFDTVGKMVKGTVAQAVVMNQTEFQSGEVLTWKDGTPRKQLVITIDTDEVDDELEGDDGSRRIYAKGQMLQAIRTAVRAHGGIAEGGKLAVKFIKEEPSKTRGFNPTKIYQAWYEAPAKKTAIPDEPTETDEDSSPF